MSIQKCLTFQERHTDGYPWATICQLLRVNPAQVGISWVRSNLGTAVGDCQAIRQCAQGRMAFRRRSVRRCWRELGTGGLLERCDSSLRSDMTRRLAPPNAAPSQGLLVWGGGGGRFRGLARPLSCARVETIATTARKASARRSLGRVPMRGMGVYHDVWRAI